MLVLNHFNSHVYLCCVNQILFADLIYWHCLLPGAPPFTSRTFTTLYAVVDLMTFYTWNCQLCQDSKFLSSLDSVVRISLNLVIGVLIFMQFDFLSMFRKQNNHWCFLINCQSVLWHCWLGGRKCIRPVKKRVMGCWHGYLSGTTCTLAYGPADATATHYLLLQ